MSKEIPLTQGLVAIVDDEDYPRVARHRWHAQVIAGRKYAVRHGPRPLGHLMIYLHRELMGANEGQQIDHVSGNGLDNRRTNLRIASQTENNANMRLPRHNTSGFKGVSWVSRRGRWLVQIQTAGRNRFVGHFYSLSDAARAYDEAAVKHFGEFARTNQTLGLL